MKFRDKVNRYQPIHQRLGPRGMNLVKVDYHLQASSLMPLTYEICWQNLPSSVNVKDLKVNYDHLSREKKQKILPPEIECRAVNENFYFNSSFM